MRTCPGCGLEEARGTDPQGRPTLNLNPITGQCVTCMVAGPKVKPMADVPFDARKAAAGDRE